MCLKKIWNLGEKISIFKMVVKMLKDIEHFSPCHSDIKKEHFSNIRKIWNNVAMTPSHPRTTKSGQNSRWKPFLIMSTMPCCGYHNMLIIHIVNFKQRIVEINTDLWKTCIQRVKPFICQISRFDWLKQTGMISKNETLWMSMGY